jgi:type III secretory pathway component EscU
MPVSTSGWAIASLICSLVGVPILGVIFGFIALNEIRNSAGRIAGEGMAKAGIIIGFIVMALGIVLAIVWIVVIGGLILTTPTNTSFVGLVVSARM